MRSEERPELIAVPNGDQREKLRFTRPEIFLLALLLATSFAVRWPFRNVSLIRDEGEYLHLGQEILRGRIPYLDVYNQKTPVVFFLMAGVQKLAGTNLVAVRVFTAFYGLLATCVLYLLARGFRLPRRPVGRPCLLRHDL